MSKENIYDYNNQICTATPKQRRKDCPIPFDPKTNRSCAGCDHLNPSPEAEVPSNTRGGETMEQSKAWRKNKLIYGIPHGDD